MMNKKVSKERFSRGALRTTSACILLLFVFQFCIQTAQGATEVKLNGPEYPNAGAHFVYLKWSHTEDWFFNNYEVWSYDGKWTMIKRITNPDETEFNVTGLAPATFFQFKIRDCDSLGHQDSNVIDVNTLSLDAVVLLQPSFDEVRASSVTLRWEVNDDSHFLAYHIVERRADGNITIDTSANRWQTEYVVTGLSSDTEYCFFIEVENTLGEFSKPSNVACFVTMSNTEPGFWDDPYHVGFIVTVASIVVVFAMWLIFRRKS